MISNSSFTSSSRRFLYTRHNNNNNNNTIVRRPKRYHHHHHNSHLVSSSSLSFTTSFECGSETKSKLYLPYGTSPILCSVYGSNGISHDNVRKMRFFSSISTPTTQELDSTSDVNKNSTAATELNDMKKMTSYLVEDIPLGEFSTDNMITSNRTIQFWAKQKSMDGILNATKVLERIIDEIAKGNPRADLSYNTIQMVRQSYIL